MSIKMYDQITYPFPNFNGSAVDVCEWISSPCALLVQYKQGIMMPMVECCIDLIESTKYKIDT